MWYYKIVKDEKNLYTPLERGKLRSPRLEAPGKGERE